MNNYMEEALKEAYNGINNAHGGPFGAVVVQNGKIVGSGHNCVLLNNDPTAHGEVMAIRDACRNLGKFSLSDCELYTTAEPCPMCLGAILWAGIKKVYYGCSRYDTENINFSDSKFYDIINNGTEKMLFQTEHKACLELFDAYSKIKNKKGY